MDKQFIDNLIYYRKKAGLSQEELADKLGVSRQAVSKWECGESAPDTENLLKLAKLYNISMDKLINGENGEQKESYSGKDKKDDEQAEFYTGKDKKDGDKRLHIHVSDDGIKIKGKRIDINLSDCDSENPDIQMDADIDELKDLAETIDDIKDGVKKAKKGVKVFYTHEDKEKFKAIFDCSAFFGLAIAFFLWGFFGSAFRISWTLFLLFPVITSIPDAVIKRKVSSFCYPVFLTFFFCLFGLIFGIWHPLWVIYLTIPVFYSVCKIFDR